MHKCIAVDRRHQCHHRSIRQIRSTFDLYLALISCYISIYCSRSLISLLVHFVSELMSKCPLQGHSIYIRLCSKLSDSALSGHTCNHTDMGEDRCDRGLRRSFSQMRSITKPIVRVITYPVQCGYVLATEFVD